VSLSAGTRLGSYEILGLIGEGGMGQVYRAFDSKLKRAVAIKILSDAMADSSERISRFEREAEVLASLNHSNIATIHDFQREAERRFIVMELVDGQTLTERLQRGPLAIDETLQIARQIADALDSAHQKGIIHRDLKPANIKIAADGKVKVLDFGLAKIFENAERSFESSNLPTAIGDTEGGVILGTVAYMSPEQARGKPVDKRTDLWAFGCVVYEMLTGKQTFARENASDTIATILREEPDWQALPAGTPPRIRVLLERCLRKDQRQRLSDAADARIEIEDATADAGVRAPVPVQSPRRGSAKLVLALLAGAAIAGVFAWIFARESKETPAPIRLSFTLPVPTTSGTDINANHRLAISPDGRKIVYEAVLGDKWQLYLRFLGEPEGRLIEGTTDARNPFFSPDSEWIAFGQGQQLQKVAVSGGSPIAICKLSGTAFYGGDWGSDDTIVFVPDVNGGLWSVSANGGTPQPILRTDVAKDAVSFSDPQVLPAGKGILLTLTSAHASTLDDLDVAVLAPRTSEPRVLIKGGFNPRYVPSGQIIYGHDGTLLSVGFDLSTLAVSGTPVSVVGSLAKAWGGFNYSVSDNGTLIYEPDSGVKNGRTFAIVDLKGNSQPVPIPPGNFDEFSVSPDGRFLAGRVFSITDDIWVYNIATGIPLRLTFAPLDKIFPQWTPDGKRIAYGTRTGKILWRPSDGTGQEEELTHGENPRYPVSFSPDGKLMAFVEIHPSRRRDIWLMPLDGNRQPQQLLATDADETDARFSPDGHWVAYVSDETGRAEIFIRPVGTSGGRRQLSSEGGIIPVWAPDSRAVFFLKGDHVAKISLDGQGNTAGHEQVLFTVPKLNDMQINPASGNYDIMPDGQHFIFEFGRSSSPTTHYSVVLNWFTELKQKMSR
jgi:eukaryotic-like serine/threonine-protein kinase